VLYARAVTLDGASILVGEEPEALPAAVQEVLVKLREDLAGAGFLGDDEVRRLDTEQRLAYTLLLCGLRPPERGEAAADGAKGEDDDLFTGWHRP
jgi:hypothetical protein